MKNLFNQDNPFWSFVAKLVDVFIVHLLWIICSLPIITFGASTTALYYVMMKEAKDEGTHYIKLFFRSFKENLKQGSILGIIFILAMGGLIYALYFYSKNVAVMGTAFQILRIVAFVILAILVMMFTYAFPLLAQFDNTIFGILKNALLFSIAKLGWTILMVALFFGYYYLFYLTMFWPLLILGFGLIAFIDAFILNHIFKPFIDDQTEEKETPEEEAEKNTNDNMEPRALTASQMGSFANSKQKKFLDKESETL